MQLFQTTDNTLAPIEKDSFKFEKDIKSLVEANMEMLFDLEFVSSEFTVGKFRLDSLAFDIQNKAFAIVEYKKGHSYSVIDQGYSYLSALLDRKAEFILEYNEKTGKQLKRNTVNWALSRVIFISPSFNMFQKNSVNFQDIPFELWEIKKFESGLIAMEQYIPNSDESIRNISSYNSDPIISKVVKEVKISSETELFSGLNQSAEAAWQIFRDRLLELPNTSIHTTQSYLSIKYDGTALIYVRFKKKAFRCDLVRGNEYSDGSRTKKFFALHDPKQVARIFSWNLKPGVKRSHYYFSISSKDDLDYCMNLVKQKYEALS